MIETLRWDRLWRRISHCQHRRDVNSVREGVAEWWRDLGCEA